MRASTGVIAVHSDHIMYLIYCLAAAAHHYFTAIYFNLLDVRL